MSKKKKAPLPELPSQAVIDEGIERLNRDLKKAAATLSKQEARYLVDSYYVLQDSRIRTSNQLRKMAESGEPHVILKWMNTQAEQLEKEIARTLDAYSNSFVLGRWMRSQYGIGPVISAGLLAYLDVTKAKGAGAYWRFAGLDPTSTWAKGQKRPWCAGLKVLCWKLGDSFSKQRNRDDDFYGHLVAERKQYEETKNERGDYKDEAAKVLKRSPGHKMKATYQQGKLPPGHIESRARRWATKIFLAHLFEVSWELKYKTAPPKPYILTIAGGHTHQIKVPNWPMEETLPSTLKNMP
jgi:hypothetical protein